VGENSKIEWTDHTWNPWIGCTRVSPACDRCYAETWANRYGTVEWGAGKPRKLTGESNWQQPLKWNREAEKAGERKRVFCASLADVFDNEADPAWRIRLFALIEKTPHLDWLLLTKRIGNARKMLPLDWGKGWPNVWLGISVVTQEEAERDIPKLAAIPATVRFLSMEPLLGPVDLRGLKTDHGGRLNAFLHDRIHWVIVGGESGKGARPMHPQWARSLRDQCVEFGVPFHFKQWGEWQDGSDFKADAKAVLNDGTISEPTPDALRALDCETPVPPRQPTMMRKVGKKAAGRMLDGRTWDELPTNAA
jgi:protein gp37